MKFDLIVIGNELLNGKIQDLNVHFLATELYAHHHTLNQVHMIADNEDQFLKAMLLATGTADVIITCGGLGPTKDDLTKKMLAKFFEKEILYSEHAHQITLKHYERGKREYDQKKIDYHHIPHEFEAIHNPIGYAPGLKYENEGKMIFACPGVPSEFQAMLTQEILPQIKSSESQFTKHVIVKTWKIPESKIFNELCPDLWDSLEAYGEVSSLPHFYGVDIGVKLVEKSLEVISSQEKEIINLMKSSPLKDYIWNIGPESIEQMIVKMAIAKNLTIGFSESCTGGLCASRMTDVSGSSAVFWGSIVSYANEVKMKSLNVLEKTLIDYGAVSKQTALEMAMGAREQLGVDIAVSTTGIAGPGGGSKDKPVGTVGIGVSSSQGNSSDIYHFQGNRVTLKKRFSDKALVILLEEIMNHS